MIVFGRGIFTGSSKMFLQQGLTETPRIVRGVFEHLYGELLDVVPALVTALIVFGIFYLIERPESWDFFSVISRAHRLHR